MSLKSKRAQASIIDFLVAFTIFLSVFTINYYLWNNINVRINNDEIPHYYQTSVYQAADVLIKKQGDPINWESNTSGINSIGLALSENVLSNEKLSALKNLNYDLIKDYVLSTGDFQIEIRNKDVSIYKTGKVPQGNVIRVERIIKINNSYYSFIFSGWNP